MRGTLGNIYRRLGAAYGPQHWWPAETPTEVVIGAILTQNTAWTNVVRAIENLKQAGLIDWKRLGEIPQAELETLLRPSGTYRLKAGRLKAFVHVLRQEHGGSLDSLLAGPLKAVRCRLLAIPGIGPETADAILLYAGGRPSFVVDNYTRRVLRRHALIDGGANYEAVRSLFHRAVKPDPGVYNEFHALLVAVGKQHCRAKARCEGCPLADLPHDETLRA